MLREYTTTGGATAQTWTWSKDYVYRGNAILASVSAPSTVEYFHQDHLGSTRVTTNATGGTTATTNYYPFGAEASPATAETKKFTGHERDYNPNGAQDYMHARYYRGGWGRFFSLDPLRDWYRPDPQSWNLYAYVRNNP